MYCNMDEWVTIRRRVLVEGVSKRQILRETGMHWTTLEKMLAHGEPPGYQRRREPAKPKIGPYLEWIGEVLKADQGLPRKQRHTALKIWRRLRDERGFTGRYTIVKDAVRQLKRRQQEVFLPQVHRPGEAQVDFGQALVLPGAACEREGRGGRDGEVRAPELLRAGALGAGLRSTERVASGAVPGGPRASAAGPDPNAGAVAGGRPGGVPRRAGGPVRRVPDAVDGGEFGVAGPVRRQRLLGAGGLRPSSGGGAGVHGSGGGRLPSPGHCRASAVLGT